jgi:hypothetical protein
VGAPPGGVIERDPAQRTRLKLRPTDAANHVALKKEAEDVRITIFGYFDQFREK